MARISAALRLPGSAAPRTNDWSILSLSTGTEVVQRKLQADGLQIVDHLVDVLVVAEEHALGDLQLQSFGGKLRFAQHRPDRRRQRR